MLPPYDTATRATVLLTSQSPRVSLTYLHIAEPSHRARRFRVTATTRDPAYDVDTWSDDTGWVPVLTALAAEDPADAANTAYHVLTHS